MDYIKCMNNANYVSADMLACRTTFAADVGACNFVAGTTECSDDMPITTAADIMAQRAMAIGEVARWMKVNVCDVETLPTSNPINFFTSDSDPTLLTTGGNCVNEKDSPACMQCNSWRSHQALQRVKGIKKCAALTATAPAGGSVYPTNVPNPLRTCTTIEIAGADADAKSDADKTAAADTTTATANCFTTHQAVTDDAERHRLIKACQLADVTTAIATTLTIRGGHACDTLGTNPTCTKDGNRCLTALCVCAAKRNGDKCDKTDAEVVPPTALAAYIHEAGLANVAQKMKDCVSLLQVGLTTVDKVLPTLAMLTTCAGEAKTKYKETVGIVADPSAQEWMAVKFAAANRASRMYMDTCAKAAYDITSTQDKEDALKLCSVNKDLRANTILGRVHVFPCVDSTTCDGRLPVGCFDSTHLTAKVRSCSASDVTDEIYTTLGPANAAKVDEANTATGSAVYDCMTAVRVLYADKAACDANLAACDLARQACTVSVATAAVAGALGKETTDASVTPTAVNKAVEKGAVASLKTNIADCMAGVDDQKTADPSTYDAASLVVAQKACVADSAKETLALSLALADKADLKQGQLEQYIEHAAGSAMVASIQACTAVAADAAAKALCVLSAGKDQYMQTRGEDSVVAGSTFPAATVRAALNDALSTEVATAVEECVKLATDDAAKKTCVWTSAKAALAASAGLTVDTTTEDGKAALMVKVARAAKASVRDTTKACVRAAHDANAAGATLKAALTACRGQARSLLVGALGKPAAEVTKEEVKEAAMHAGATSLSDGNKGCRKAAMAIIDAAAQLQAKKECFSAAAAHVADATGVTYDATASTGTTTTVSAGTLNSFDLKEMKTAAAAKSLAKLAAACQTENDAASCTPTKLVEEVAAAYGTNSDGTDPIDITTATTPTSIDENKAKFVKVVKKATFEIISDAADACINTDEATDTPISRPGTDTAVNGVRDCAKAFADANGYVTLNTAAIPAYATTFDAPTKLKRWKRDFKQVVMKKMCMRFRMCNKDDTKTAGECMTEAIAFAKKYIVPGSVTDWGAWVKKALFKCRAHLRAEANECDSTTKADCKAVLTDARTGASENTVGANAPATVNEGGKTHEAGIERDNAAIDAAAQAFADCKDAFTTADWDSKKYDCREVARLKFELNGGNAPEWTSRYMSKVETLGDTYQSGDESTVFTLPSVDYEVEFAGVCTKEKTASVNALVKTACGGAACIVKDIEQVTITTSTKCAFKYRVKHATSCTDKTTCDAFSATLAAQAITFSGRRRRLLETVKPLAGTTSDICPSTGCTYPPEGKVGASVESHTVARKNYIRCMIKANFDATAGDTNAKLRCRKALAAALAHCTSVTCSDDMPVTDGAGIAEQIKRAVADTHAYFMAHVCNVVDFTASGLTLYSAVGGSLNAVTDGGACMVATPTDATKRMCMMCRARIEDAQRRVEGIRACGTVDSLNNMVARPTRICDATQTAAADTDAADATEAAGEADTVTASQTCYDTWAATSTQKVRECQLASVTAAIAGATTASGGHACDTAGTNPTCTDHGSMCVSSVCVCAAGRNGERCDKLDGEVVKPATLASYIRRAALKRLADQMQMCVRLLQVDVIGTTAGVVPTQVDLTTCEGTTKTDYIKTIGATVTAEEWTAAKNDAGAIATREYLEP